MMPRNPINNLQFLAGGGEMGSRTREKDWSNTPVGNPETWPQSLRTTLSIILNSKFPMFLWWGAELICFYNDAYRPSLGNNGKHPGILGKPAAEAWPEIWDTIQPLINEVIKGGESTWSEDQLIPIYRNGKMEDVYWTFSYSPVHDESGTIAGVLVTCTETTDKIESVNKLKENIQRVRAVVESASFPIGVYVGKEMRIELANQSILDVWGKGNDVIGKLYTDILPELDNQHIFDQLDQVYTTGIPFHAKNQQVDLIVEGLPRTYFFNYSFTPLYNTEGKIYGVMNTAADVTDLNMAKQKIEESEKRFRNSVKQAPLGITILRGRNFVVEMANDTYLQLVDKTEESFVGKPLFDSLPEVKEIVDPLLSNVLTTGIAFVAPELSAPLNRYGKKELGYFNLIYHPLKENNEITGIMVVATEVTDSVKARHTLAESEKQFRNLVMQSPIPMTIFRGAEYVIEMANTMMYENIWRKKESEVVGRKVLDVFPELKEQKYPELLHKVFTTGITHTEKESVAYVQRDSGLQKFYLDFEYAALYETDGTISGIMITVNDVTEKVDARLKVEDSEKQFRNIAERLNIVIDASELGTWEWDLVNDQVDYSGKYLEIFGYKEGMAMEHAKHVAHIHPEDKMERDIAVTKALKKGFLDYELRIIWNDGSVHWIEAKGKVFYDGNQQPVKLIGTVRDTTEEKKRQQELLENEQRFRLLADSMPQHIWTADTEGNLNYYNQSVFDYSGLTLEKIDEDGWLQIVHPDDREENIRQWTEAITTGNDFLFEHRFRRHDGEYRWQLSRAIPQKDPNGKIQMWVGTSTDIQDQKMFTSELERQVRERTKELLHLNESLAKSEERYHLMVEEVEDYAILYLSTEGIVENWNKGAEKIKGYTAEEIIGKSFSVFYPEKERKERLPESLLAEAVSKGKAMHEGWRIRKDGSAFWASVAITAVHDANKNVIGFSKVTHDLTIKKTAEDKLRMNAEQLEQNNRELQKMNAELQSFAYVSSHDLQEPLRKIQTFASRILSKELENLSDNGKDYFRRMQEAAGRMQTLIQDLLAYSRTNTTDRPFENIDLADIVNEVKTDIREMHTEKNAVIEVGHMEQVNVIPFQFRQLLYNLIGNAIKFARPGIAPHIIIASEIVKGDAVKKVPLSHEKTYCHISVADNGIGFDQQYRDRIFEVFQRLHGKDEYSGTGIGLAIVKKIVENHNGVITARGEINNGATFDIYIPA